MLYRDLFKQNYNIDVAATVFEEIPIKHGYIILYLWLKYLKLHLVKCYSVEPIVYPQVKWYTKDHTCI